MGIMVRKANGYYLSILGFKSCIFTSATKTLSTNSFRDITNKSFRLRGRFVQFCCKGFDIFQYLCTIST